jgi:asparagine synthase (glutamine-hydrolysing)
MIVGHRLEGPSTNRRSRRPGVLDSTVAQRANQLCDTGWGAYAALLQDPGEGGWWAFRDPSGAVEAFTWALGDLAILASGLEAIPPRMLPPNLSLDWTAIADFLRRPASLVGRSALRGLETITPGDLQPLGAPSLRAIPIWRPRDWLPVAPDVDPAWPESLALTVQATIAGLVEPYTNIVTEVSGGLDSSIVNAGLARAGLIQRVSEALHYAGEPGEADERSWAEELCARWALPMISVPRSSAPFDPSADFDELVRGARPPYAALDAARDRDTAERLRACGAQALVTGNGGDAVFFQMPTSAVVADLWADVGRAALSHPQNSGVARWLRQSVWSVWREGLGAAAERPSAPAIGRFAGWALRDLAVGPEHPWLQDLQGARPAKRIQIRALVGSHLALGSSRRSAQADLVQPLLAQPVLQLCLSIPSWELVRGGRDRGLAREAFAGWLPDAVATRRSKGALTSAYSRRAAASLEALRAHLLDGVLAQAGLLDKAEMDAALTADQLIWQADGLKLIRAAAVESWVRHWQARIPDAADAARPRA